MAVNGAKKTIKNEMKKKMKSKIKLKTHNARAAVSIFVIRRWANELVPVVYGQNRRCTAFFSSKFHVATGNPFK